MKRPLEHEYSSFTAYARALENYCTSLEQPEPETVAWTDEQGNVRMTFGSGDIQSSVGYVYSVHGERIKNACIKSDIPNGTPLYTSPPKREPLTDEEIERLHFKYAKYQQESMGISGWVEYARAIEQAHGIKGEA